MSHADWVRSNEQGPAPRYQAAMVYDAFRKQTILFGGVNTDGYLHDTWAWNGKRWKLLSQAGPSGRSEAAMAYDSHRHRIVLFGGYVSGQLSNETWEWDGKVWTHITNLAPYAREGSALAYDPRLGACVLFGGATDLNNTGASEETWGWNGANWSLYSTTGPLGRMYSKMEFDPVRRQLLLFGGCDNSGKLLGDTWILKGIKWEQVLTGDATPRADFSMTYHAGLKKILKFGGVGMPEPAPDSGETLANFEAWNGSKWVSFKTANEPPALRAPMMAYDRLRGNLVLFGGEPHNRKRDFLSQTWLSVGSRSSKITIRPRVSNRRQSHVPVR